MNTVTLVARIEALITKASGGTADDEAIAELTQGTLTILRAVYGPKSAQEAALDLRSKMAYAEARPDLVSLRSTIRGVLRNLKGELETGMLGTIQAQITGAVLADFTSFAKEALADTSEGAKNVAAVLSAAAFEDLLRRLGVKHSLPHYEKLADLHTALKDAGVLKGAQVATSQSFLTFRNRALHARWDQVDHAVVQSCIAFTEQMLVQHFE